MEFFGRATQAVDDVFAHRVCGRDQPPIAVPTSDAGGLRDVGPACVVGSHVYAGEQVRLGRVGKSVHVWRQTPGAQDDARVVQRAAATECELAPVRVDGGDLPLPVAVQIEEGGVDAPAPRLGVEDRRSQRRFCGGLVQEALDVRSGWRGPRNSHKTNVRLAVGAIVSEGVRGPRAGGLGRGGLRPERHRGAGVTDWSMVFDGESAEGVRESLCTLGNGYVATRGAAPEHRADGVHYPGTYLAGCYNRLRDMVHGEAVETESMVNIPNWLPMTLRIGDGPWLGEAGLDLFEERYELDLQGGQLTREFQVRDAQSRVATVTQRRSCIGGWRTYAACRRPSPRTAGPARSLLAPLWTQLWRTAAWHVIRVCRATSCRTSTSWSLATCLGGGRSGNVFHVELTGGGLSGAGESLLRMVRLHLFHVLQTVSVCSAGLDVGVPARGLHGEAYWATSGGTSCSCFRC